jgi:ATP:cob(I)alamin adenosyltransferase
MKDDGIAGITGALIVLPQAVAFATIAGLPPEYGIYAAMVPTIIAALFGSSWHLVSGPTTAISIVVFASVSPYAEPGTPEYIGMVLTLTFLTGLFQLIMGLAKMGALVNFISHTVVIGFTAGAALLIAASQVKNFFGLDIERGAPAYEVVRQLMIQIGDLNPYITGVAVVSLIAGLLARKYLKKVPYMIVAMVAGGILAAILDAQSSATKHPHQNGRRPGRQPASAVDAGLLPGGVEEHLLLGPGGHRAGADRGGFHLALHRHQVRAAHQRQPGVHRPGPVQPVRQLLLRLRLQRFLQPQRRQLRIRRAHAPGGGVLLHVPAAGAVPGGAPGRPSAHSRHGGGAVSGGLEPDRLPPHRRHPQGAPARGRGAGRELFRHGHRPGKGYLLRHRRLPDLLPPGHVQAGHPLSRAGREGPGQPAPQIRGGNRRRAGLPPIKMLRIEGSIFFGAVDHVQQAFVAVDEHVPSQKHLLLFSKGINTIDLAGAEMLAREAQRRRKLGGGLYLCGVRDATCGMLKKGGYQADIGESHVFVHKPDAVAGIYARLDSELCRTCNARIFWECQERLPNGKARPADEIAKFADKRETDSGATAGFKRLTEIVTRGGDDGTTGIADGTRMPKHAPRIEAIGAVDELNSQMGVLLDTPIPADLRPLLVDIQHDLFNLGAELAWPEVSQLHEENVLRLDQAIATFNAGLPPLTEFVLPGGTPAAAQAHICRTVCRRAERRLSTLSEVELISPKLGQYLNRLSDLLFVLSRRINRVAGQVEPVWRGPASRS